MTKKKIKRYLNDFKTDTEIDSSIIEIKEKISFNKDQSNILLKRRTRQRLTFLMLFLICSASFFGLGFFVRHTTNTDNQHTESYLTNHFDKHIDEALETIVYQDLLLSFYLGVKDENYYLIVHSKMSNNYSITIFITSEETMTLNSATSYAYSIITENRLTVSIEIKLEEKINQRYVSFELEDFIAHINMK